MGNIIDSKFFISYNHLDKDLALELITNLKHWKFNCFIDEVIAFNEDFRERINRELTTSSDLFVFISENSIHSQWVGFEIGIAKGAGINVIPIIISPCQVPTLLEPYKYLTINDHIDKIKLIELLIQLEFFEDGFVSKNLMQDYPKRFPNEVFAEEVLKQSMQLIRNQQKIQIQINRNDIDYVLISNKGKKYFCDKYILDEQNAKKLDIEIHNFQMNESNENRIIIPIDQYPIRWMSGGTLSIVNFKNKEWIPLFFRDIDPIGWNISLGGSERDFSAENRNGVFNSLNQDLNCPVNVMLREFLEETLILDKAPDESEPANIMRFIWDGVVNIEQQKEKAERFSRNHVRLRQNNDLLNILADTNRSDEFLRFGIPTSFDKTNTTIQILDGEANRIFQEWNILAAINILELGIEIVKIINYEIKDNYYFLDGEILKHSDDSEELVRMPFILLSIDYLKKKLSNIDISTIFATGRQSSFIIDGLIDNDEVILFDWDIKQRIRISKNTTINKEDKEVNRYRNWYGNFGIRYFCNNENQIIKSKLPLIFTPSTVKLLKYYFALQGE